VVADGEFVVAGGDRPVLLEPGDGPLDHVALPVAHRIDPGRPATPWASAGSGRPLVGPLGDGVRDPASAQQLPAGGVAVAAVSGQMRWPLAGPTQPAGARDPDGIQQRLELGALMALSGGDHHPKRPPAAIAGQMELGGQPTATTAQCLVGLRSRSYVAAGAPFRAPAACWWARTMVASTTTSQSTSLTASDLV
jgi:hypothetical protein